jgi:peptide/nickel transport system substrate-binding protein
VPTVKKNIEDRLGISVEVKPVQTTTQISNAHEDKRTHHLGFWFHNPSPDRLDPHEMTRRYAADWAGANGRPNPSNYASCDHTTPAIEQQTATSEEERQSLVTEAQSAMSSEYGTIPLVRIIGFAAGRSDSVSLNGTGDMGITQLNPNVFIQSTPNEGDSIIVATNTDTTSTRNFPTLSAVYGLAPWNHLIHSTLLEYNENFGLEEMLAESYEVGDDGSQITVSLKDTTFHNGDPITAADVKFTYEQLASHPGVYPKASIPEYSEINAVDDSTVEFNFKEPALPFITKSLPRWGIMHRDSWIEAGAQDSPENASPDPLIGSGPFQLDNLETGQSMQLVPHDGHPVHSPGHNLIFQSYQNEQTKVQSFNAGEIDLVQNISPGGAERIRRQLNDGQFTVTQFRGFIPFLLYPQCPQAPTKFGPFRNAVSKVIDRREINQVALDGESEPVTKSCPILDNHPFRPPEGELATMTEEPTGDEEAAREVLRDAGWEWDDNDRLRYPADADMSPIWSEGEQPTSESFACLDGEGNYAG